MLLQRRLVDRSLLCDRIRLLDKVLTRLGESWKRLLNGVDLGC